MLVRPIPIEQARPIRQCVLRPGQPFEASIYPLDGAAETAHFGVFLDERLVGVASICRQSPLWVSDPDAWRLRGVAVLDAARGLGCGRALLEACLGYARQKRGSLVWCNGRTTALAFYQALGFQTHGDPFIDPISGPHYWMWRQVFI